MPNLRFPAVDKFLVQADDAPVEIEAPEEKVDSSAYLDPFELSPEREEFLKEFNLEGDIEVVGGEDEVKMAKLKPDVAEELARTENLFKSGEVADERMAGMDDSITQMVKEMGAEVAPGFEFDVSVSAQEDSHGNPAHYYRVTLSKGDQEKELEILYYTYEPWVQLQEAASSWDWAAWLGLPESPFYDEAFLDAYDEDQVSIAMGEMLATFKESQDYWDMKDAIKSLAESHVPKFEFYVNMDERGEFRADVRNEAGETVYEIQSDEEGTIPQVEDGFMRNVEDLQGLERYLVELGIMPKNAELVKGN